MLIRWAHGVPVRTAGMTLPAGAPHPYFIGLTSPLGAQSPVYAAQAELILAIPTRLTISDLQHSPEPGRKTKAG